MRHFVPTCGTQTPKMLVHTIVVKAFAFSDFPCLANKRVLHLDHPDNLEYSRGGHVV